MIELSTDKFSYDKKERTFCSEISTLNCNLLQNLRLRNSKTSGSMIFHHISIKRDADQDVLYWTYRGTLGGESYFLRIYND